MLSELAFASDLPLPATPPSNKRERDSDSPASEDSLSPSPFGPSDSLMPPGKRLSLVTPDVPTEVREEALPRTIIGSTRAKRQRKGREVTVPQLPVYTTELGSFPYPEFADVSSGYWMQRGSVPMDDGTGVAFQVAQMPGGGLERSDSSTFAASPSPVMDGTVYDQSTFGMGTFVQQPHRVPGAVGPGVFSGGLPQVGSCLPAPWTLDGAGYSGHTGVRVNETIIPRGVSNRGIGQMTGALGLDMNIQPRIDDEMFAMWSAAPTGFECVSPLFYSPSTLT